MGRNGKKKEDKAEVILDYIYYLFESGDCIRRPVTVERVAQHFGITSRHLERIFKKSKTIKTSPKKCILRIQLVYAGKYTILNPEICLKELMYNLGIKDRDTLENLCRRFHNTTPENHWNLENNARRARSLVEKFKMSGF